MFFAIFCQWQNNLNNQYSVNYVLFVRPHAFNRTERHLKYVFTKILLKKKLQIYTYQNIYQTTVCNKIIMTVIKEDSICNLVSRKAFSGIIPQLIHHTLVLLNFNCDGYTVLI